VAPNDLNPQSGPLCFRLPPVRDRFYALTRRTRRNPNLTAALKVRHGEVQELGIADNSLTSTLRLQSLLAPSFY
jgi:hypothetical protein